jgi:Tfp pilus assembly protein PilV
MVFPRTQPAHAPRGITLLEVLIAMGILTIGLVSVAALVPAGRSQAMKAAIYDRS